MFIKFPSTNHKFLISPPKSASFAEVRASLFFVFIINSPCGVETRVSSAQSSSRRPKRFRKKNELKSNFPFTLSTLFVGNDEQHEIQRQNRITEQILTNFFERRFFPNRKPKPAPTIDEILPPESRANPSILKHKENDDDEPETDNLQSVESEHVDSFYRDYQEGRWQRLLKSGVMAQQFYAFLFALIVSLFWTIRAKHFHLPICISKARSSYKSRPNIALCRQSTLETGAVAIF